MCVFCVQPLLSMPTVSKPSTNLSPHSDTDTDTDSDAAAAAPEDGETGPGTVVGNSSGGGNWFRHTSRTHAQSARGVVAAKVGWPRAPLLSSSFLPPFFLLPILPSSSLPSLLKNK
jgi:hypothetical protein